jgi:antitoxin component YwqK of YwqJK toxin-antitoxin module
VDEYIEYYESGAIRVTGQYDRGLKTGLWTTFFEDPNVKQIEEFYVKNRISGPGGRKTYNIIGILISSEDFPVYS